KTQHLISRVIDFNVGSFRSDNRGEEWSHKATRRMKLLKIRGAESVVIGQTPSNRVIQTSPRVVEVGFKGLGVPGNGYSSMGWPQDAFGIIGEEKFTPHVRVTAHVLGTRQFSGTNRGTPIGMLEGAKDISLGTSGGM
ncbi:hypothetical protein GIB67_006516, partial [Kingdonia uniflora]